MHTVRSVQSPATVFSSGPELADLEHSSSVVCHDGVLWYGECVHMCWLACSHVKETFEACEYALLQMHLSKSCEETSCASTSNVNWRIDIATAAVTYTSRV